MVYLIDFQNKCVKDGFYIKLRKDDCMEKFLSRLQIKLFEIGSTKSHFIYERLGNLVQDIRTFLNGRRM